MKHLDNPKKKGNPQKMNKSQELLLYKRLNGWIRLVRREWIIELKVNCNKLHIIEEVSEIHVHSFG